jgi:hypothetical protein
VADIHLAIAFTRVIVQEDVFRILDALSAARYCLHDAGLEYGMIEGTLHLNARAPELVPFVGFETNLHRSAFVSKDAFAHIVVLSDALFNSHLQSTQHNGDESAPLISKHAIQKLYASYPPVLVPQIRLKTSQGFMSSFDSFFRSLLTLSMMLRRMYNEDSPLTPPPSATG